MTADLAALERALSRTALSMRVQAGLDWASVALSASAVCVGLWQLAAAREPTTGWLASVVLSSSLAAGLGGVLWPVPSERVARAIDCSGELEGRVLAAVSFSREPPERRTAFMDAALRDAAHRASHVSPRRAAPLHAPRASFQAVLALLALLACVLARRPPTPAHVPGASALPRVTAPLLDRDELLGLRAEVAGSVRDTPLSPALRAQLEAYSALLTQLGEPGLADEDAVARALALEAKLPLQVRSAHDDALLHTLAAELSRAQPELSQALRRELAEAARTLHRLSDDVRSDKLPASERAQLTAALAHARARERERLTEAARDDQRGRLLHGPQPAQSGERSVLLHRPERDGGRELEALRRGPPQQPQRRELQRLSRELARAGDALQERQNEQAADALEQASAALSELEEHERERAQGQELARAVAQLRELLQRRAQAKSARSQPAQPSPAAGEPGEPTQNAGATSAATRRRTFQARASGADAQTDGGTRSPPSETAGAGTPSQPSSSTATTPVLGLVQRRVEVVESVRVGAGSEHDARHAATPSRPRTDVAYQDHLLRGALGPGPTRSQVIQGAAGGGFANTAYRKVYGDYRAHAETVLERDEVPPGARFQVRRYFELVRPREGQDTHD